MDCSVCIAKDDLIAAKDQYIAALERQLREERAAHEAMLNKTLAHLASMDKHTANIQGLLNELTARWERLLTP